MTGEGEIRIQSETDSRQRALESRTAMAEKLGVDPSRFEHELSDEYLAEVISRCKLPRLASEKTLKKAREKGLIE